MKSLLLFPVLLLFSGCGQETKGPTSPAQPGGPADSTQIAVFADTSLEAAVHQALGKPPGPLTREELLSLSRLVARGRGIRNLQGIEQLDSLTTLDLADNQIQDLSPLAALTQLTYLELGHNQVRDLAPLSGLSHLAFLGLDYNPVGGISPLLALKDLLGVSLVGVVLADTVSSRFLASLQEQGVEIVTAVSDTTTPNAPADLISKARILFYSKADKYSDWEILTMDADGGDWARLLPSNPMASSLTWSPDGEKVAYVTYLADVWVINKDGTASAWLYHGRSTADVLGALAWSPDGQRIAFLKGRQKGPKVEDWQVYTMSATGTDTLRLTDSEGEHDRPCWSPDGQRIAFASSRTGKSDIYAMDADGSNPVQLTDDPVWAYDPAWSPDGQRIAFVSGRDGNSEIYVMDVDGSDPVRLTREPTLDNHPTWSPDSREIAFATQRDGNWDIYVMQADGSGLVNLTWATSDEWGPEWSPR